MKIEMKKYSGLPCQLEVFKINDIKADLNDFGTSEDIRPELAEPYSCGYSAFKRDSSKRVLCEEKYHITEGDFDDICSKLEGYLEVGECHYCV